MSFISGLMCRYGTNCKIIVDFKLSLYLK
ncbi:MAG: hypothetical protein ACD_16C00236G0001, partial [uncultured bacterium]